MKKTFFLIVVVFIVLSAYGNLAFSQEDQTAKNLSVEKLLKEKIAALYEKAVFFYNQGNLKEADELLIKILKVEPSHQGASRYLYDKIPDLIASRKAEEKELKIQEALARKRPLKENINALYKKTVALYKRDQLVRAKEFFKLVLELNPDHKGAKLYLDKKIPAKIKAKKEAEENQRRKSLKRKVDALYKKAVASYNNNELDRAGDIFYQIFELDPDHKGAKSYLRRKIPDKLELAALEDKYFLQFQKEQETLERARQEQFAKQEAIIEKTTKAYQKQIAKEAAVVFRAQESVKQPIETKPAVVDIVPEEEIIPEEENVSLENSQYEYLISTGDTLKISLYGEPDMEQLTKVSENGGITYPFLGSIRVKGLTAREVEKKIADLLGKEYFVNPQVSVSIKIHAKFNILGEVRRPGSYEISGPMTVIDAISIAGGFTDIASKNGVKVVRKNGDKTEIIKIPVRRILKTGDSSKNIYLQKGDTIVVPESFF